MPDFLLGSILGSILIPSKFSWEDFLTKVMFSLNSSEVKHMNLNDIAFWGQHFDTSNMCE